MADIHMFSELPRRHSVLSERSDVQNHPQVI